MAPSILSWTEARRRLEAIKLVSEPIARGDQPNALATLTTEHILEAYNEAARIAAFGFRELLQFSDAIDYLGADVFSESMSALGTLNAHILHHGIETPFDGVIELMLFARQTIHGAIIKMPQSV